MCSQSVRLRWRISKTSRGTNRVILSSRSSWICTWFLHRSAFVYMFVKSNVSGASVDATEPNGDASSSSTADLVNGSNVQNKRKDILTFRRTPRPVSSISIFSLDWPKCNIGPIKTFHFTKKKDLILDAAQQDIQLSKTFLWDTAMGF